MGDFRRLTEAQIDALTEVGSIGAAHAATALSQLSDQQIMITVPAVRAVPLTEMPDLVGAPEKLLVAIYAKVLGEAQSRSLLLFPRESALNLVDILMKRPLGTAKFLSEMDRSCLNEAGNILTGSFLTTLSDFLDILLMPSPPELAFDMVGAILEFIATEFAGGASYLFCIQNEFIDASNKIGGSFLLIFHRELLDLIISKVELKMKDRNRGKGSQE